MMRTTLQQKLAFLNKKWDASKMQHRIFRSRKKSKDTNFPCMVLRPLSSEWSNLLQVSYSAPENSMERQMQQNPTIDDRLSNDQCRPSIIGVDHQSSVSAIDGPTYHFVPRLLWLPFQQMVGGSGLGTGLDRFPYILLVTSSVGKSRLASETKTAAVVFL